MLRRTHTAVLLIVTLLTMAGFTHSASAQGTFGALPDPISSHDLNSYAERLGLSDQQMLAIGEPHAQYLEQFRQLRENDIERFFDQFRSMRRGRFDPSQLELFEPIVKDFNRLMSRIRTLDESFFNEIQGLLTADQTEGLMRVRQQRERERYRSEATRFVDFLNPAVRVDLSEMIHSLELAPGDLGSIDQYLASYEHQLTNTSRRVYDSAVKTVLDGLKQINELGLTEDMMENPGQLMRMFDTFQQIWADVTKDLLKDADQLTDLNRRSFKQLATMLPEDEARLLREQYISRAYPEAAPIGRSAEAHFVAALEMEELPADLRGSVSELAAAHISRQDRLAEQMIDLLETRRRNLTLMQMAGMGEDQTQAKMEEIEQRAKNADESAIETLKAMLGPGLAEQLKPASATTVRRDRIAMRRGDDRGRRGGGQRERRRGMGSRGMYQGVIDFLTETQPPDRISTARINELADQLNLDDMQLALLESLHSDYLDRFEVIRREHAAPYVRIVDELRRQDERPDFNELAQRIDEAIVQLQSLLDAVQAADERFIDDLRIAVIDAEEAAQENAVLTLQSARERARYRMPAPADRSGAAAAFGGSSDEARVDLANILAALELERNERNSIAPILAEYEREAAGLFRRRFESELTVHRQSLQFVLGRNRGNNDEGQARERMRAVGARMNEVREETRNTSRALTELNRRTLDALLEVAPEHTVAQIEDAYYREAFPAVFDDPASAERRIQAALQLQDLTEAQRSQILEVAADYRPQYMDLTYQILEHHLTMADAPAWGGPRQRQRGGGGEDRSAAFAERMERASSLDVLSFDRTELNERTMRQLRAILRPDQLERLPSSSERAS